MPARHKIPFDGAVSSLMQKNFGPCKINKAGKEFVAELMSEIHATLIKNFETEYGSSKEINNDAVIKCIVRSVNKSFPSDLRRYAVEEANRQLLLFKNGWLKYDHISSIGALKSSPEYCRKFESQKTGTMYRAFTSAVSKIVSNMFSDLKIDNNAKEFIGFHVYNMANEVASRASEIATEKSQLEYSDIKDILPEFLTSGILSYAQNEGVRMLVLYTEGLQVFKPRKPSISGPELTSVAQNFLKRKNIAKEDHVDLKDTLSFTSTIFRTGVRKVLSRLTCVSSLSNTDEGSKKISDVIFSIANFLSTAVSEFSQRENLNEIDFIHIKAVMDEIFPRVLFDHAVANGYENVKNNLKGILKYRKRVQVIPKVVPAQKKKTGKTESPKKRLKAKLDLAKRRKKEKISKAKSKGKPPMKVAARYLQMPSRDTAAKKTVKEKRLSFTKGILDFYQKSFKNPSTTIGREATERINSCLSDICKTLIIECTSQNPSVSAETVRATVESFFPHEISKCAISAAHQMIVLHDKLKMDFQKESEEPAETLQQSEPEPIIKEEHVTEEDEEMPDQASDETVDEEMPDKASDETVDEEIPDQASDETVTEDTAETVTEDSADD